MGSRKAQENVGQNGTLNQSYIKMQKQFQKHSIIFKLHKGVIR